MIATDGQVSGTEKILAEARATGIRLFSLGSGSAGASLELNSDLRPELLLFHEGPSRILISTSSPEAVAAIAGRHGVEALAAGVTIESGLEIRNRNSPLLSVSMDSLRTIYQGSLESQLRS